MTTEFDAVADGAETLVEKLAREFMTLPRPGTPASELTDRERLAVAISSGVPWALEWAGTAVTCRALVPFAVVDDCQGGYALYMGTLRRP